MEEHHSLIAREGLASQKRPQLSAGSAATHIHRVRLIKEKNMITSIVVGSRTMYVGKDLMIYPTPQEAADSFEE